MFKTKYGLPLNTKSAPTYDKSFPVFHFSLSVILIVGSIWDCVITGISI